MKSLTLAALALCCFGAPSLAATFGADTASASSEFSGSYVAENTLNGSGLSTAGGPGASHADYAQGNHWTTVTNDTVGAFIDWNFDGPSAFGGIYLWTHRSNIIANNAGYEPVRFDLALFDSADANLATYTGVDLAPDTDLSQAFYASSVTTDVSRVRFTVAATQLPDTPFTGLAEVLFDDSNVIAGATLLDPTDPPAPVPLPAGLPLMLAGLGALAAVATRRRDRAA